MKRAAVFGGAGFIGSHLCARLVREGYEVTAYDRKMPEFGWCPATRYHLCDLRDLSTFEMHFKAGRYDEVYNFAAEMGGAGYVFTGKNDADILTSSVKINVNCLEVCRGDAIGRVFFASSACVYESIPTKRNDLWRAARGIPEDAKLVFGCKEDEHINPDSDYGLEKLFSEHLYDAFNRNYGLTARIGRFHNIFGPFGTWRGGREKAPAALCRKIAEAQDGDEIEIWGSGQQTRSFLYVDEAVEGVIRLMRSDYGLPVNIGSDEVITIDGLAQMICGITMKPDIRLKHVPGPVGVDGRNSDNTLIEYVLKWRPTQPLRAGLVKTYDWIAKEVDKLKAAA
jgi:nucleoside-diphosphate-sugar epimerase